MSSATFPNDVWALVPTLKYAARRHWPYSPYDREDGISETVVKALENARLFDGSNLSAWLKTIMRNVKRDQRAKGYAKGAKARNEGPRLVYAGHYDYAAHMPTLCTPEAILIAAASVRPSERSRGKYGPSYVWTFDDGREITSR